jgi:hypothetical protein
MTIAIRLADIAAERDMLIDVLREHLNPRTNAARFDWLYGGNPQGPVRVWVAVDDATNAVVGSCAAAPRYFYIGGRRELGCVFLDFWVHPSYRFLGPAASLQRACMEPVRTGEFRVAYDFPQRSMIAIYKRLRVPVRDELVTQAKVVRADRFLANRVRAPGIASALSALVNPLLRLADARLNVAHDIDVSVEAGPCGPEFAELAERVNTRYGVHVARTPEYLEWRFRRHFNHRYEIVTARRRGVLIGYIVVLDDPETSQLNVVDCYGEPDPASVRALLVFAVRLTRARGRSVTAASFLTSDARVNTASSLGFRCSKTGPLILVHPQRDAQPARADDEPCMFTYADEAD